MSKVRVHPEHSFGTIPIAVKVFRHRDAFEHGRGCRNRHRASQMTTACEDPWLPSSNRISITRSPDRSRHSNPPVTAAPCLSAWSASPKGRSRRRRMLRASRLSWVPHLATAISGSSRRWRKLRGEAVLLFVRDAHAGEEKSNCLSRFSLSGCRMPPDRVPGRSVSSVETAGAVREGDRLSQIGGCFGCTGRFRQEP